MSLDIPKSVGLKATDISSKLKGMGLEFRAHTSSKMKPKSGVCKKLKKRMCLKPSKEEKEQERKVQIP